MNLDEIDCKELLKRLLSYYGLIYIVDIPNSYNWETKYVKIIDKNTIFGILEMILIKENII